VRRATDDQRKRVGGVMVADALLVSPAMLDNAIRIGGLVYPGLGARRRRRRRPGLLGAGVSLLRSESLAG
jgi:hypothetical protein